MLLFIKPATLHDAINMARELIEQGVQAKALRIAKGRALKRRNLPWSIGAKGHIIHPGPVLLGGKNVTSLCPREGECRTRIPVARDNSLQNVSCFVMMGNHGYYNGWNAR
ncbi:hypothetical protein Tco_0553925 [Tanacetum coccineum]